MLEHVKIESFNIVWQFTFDNDPKYNQINLEYIFLLRLILATSLDLSKLKVF